MPVVNRLTIAGYKSIRDLGNLELRNLNVLIGANGAGKSNFIGFFRMLAEMYEQRLQLYVQKQGGPDALLHFSRKTTDRIRAELHFSGKETFDSTYSFELVPTQDNRLVFADEQVRHVGDQAVPGDRHFALGFGHTESHVISSELKFPQDAQPTIGSWRVYHFHDTGETARVKQVHATNDTLRLKADAANLAAYLRMLRKNYEAHYRMIVDTVRLVAPFFGDFVHRDDGASTIELEWTEKGNADSPFKAHMLSDGTLRLICLSTLLLQPWSLMPSTILIDEPELGLHPYAINVLADLIKRASEQRQLIISTQSVELLNHFEPADIIVVDRKNEASTFSRLDEASLKEWLDDYSLGDLWKQNVLGPTFRGVADTSGQPPSRRAQEIETLLHEDIIAFAQCRPQRFLPHIQSHEFEALLFSDVSRLSEVEPEWAIHQDSLRQAGEAVENPEWINDSPETAPSKRLRVLKPKYRKVTHGPMVAAKIGLDRIREMCPHFRQWFARISSLRPL